jgi:EVE domain
LHNWIFQANPDRYDIVSVLENNQPIDAWLIQRHADDVRPGDRVAIWVGGRRFPGVYAVGTVTGTPSTAVIDDPWWQRSEDHDAPMLRCPVRFDNILLDAPITRSDLQADPDLKAPAFSPSRSREFPFSLPTTSGRPSPTGCPPLQFKVTVNVAAGKLDTTVRQLALDIP